MTSDKTEKKAPGPGRTMPGDDPQTVGEPLETEEGTRRPAQQNTGPGVEEGGGEFPDPNTPPRLPAPGAADQDDEPDLRS